MRTVSFSDRNVQRRLNRDFVNTFTNTVGDPSAGMSITHRPGEQPGFCVRGNGKQNVQTIFLSPEGSVFHASTGFLPPEELSAEIEFAAELFKKIEAGENDDQIVVASHRERLVNAGFSNAEVDDRSPMASMNMLAKQLAQSSIQGMRNGNPRFGGSTNRNRENQSAMNFGDPMAAFSRMQILDDNKFSMNYPMIGYETLEREPAKLVGHGKSFFASQSFSN